MFNPLLNHGSKICLHSGQFVSTAVYMGSGRAVGRDLEVGQPKSILLARRGLEV